MLVIPFTDGDARQTGAAVKSTKPNAGHAIRNGDAFQAGAVAESIIPDAGDRIAA